MYCMRCRLSEPACVFSVLALRGWLATPCEFAENSNIVLPRICMKYQHIFCRLRIRNNVCITVWGAHRLRVSYGQQTDTHPKRRSGRASTTVSVPAPSIRTTCPPSCSDLPSLMKPHRQQRVPACPALTAWSPSSPTCILRDRGLNARIAACEL